LPNTTCATLITTTNISLPDALKAFVDQQVDARGYSSSSECVRELIRKDQDIQNIRGMLLDGARSAATAPVDAA
jgi:antitoxin ParD1/3/4